MSALVAGTNCSLGIRSSIQELVGLVVANVVDILDTYLKMVPSPQVIVFALIQQRFISKKDRRENSEANECMHAFVAQE